MLSQLGCVTLPSETIDAVYNGESLTPEEQAQYDAHPSVAYGLISRIPRLEPIAWMIEHQNRPLPPEQSPETADIRRGAEILRLILAYEEAIHKGKSRNEAAYLLARRNPQFSPEFFNALVTLDPNAEDAEIKPCIIEDLSPGMTIQQEVQTVHGALVISKGQEVTSTVIFKLKNLHARHAIADVVRVSMPKAAAGCMTTAAGKST